MSELGPRDHLPPWRSVLAVVAQPNDESFGHGAVPAGFADAGAAVAVLCFTHGESSTLHCVDGEVGADGLLVFDTDGVTGHDHGDINLVVAVDRTRQPAAVACHPSRAVPGTLLWRRLDLLGDTENLRWLRLHPHHRKGTSSS